MGLNSLLVILFGILLLLTASCGSRSLEDYQEEGEGVVRSLLQDLRKIQTKEELIAASPKLQRRFDHLVSIMIEARQFEISHPGSEKKGSSLNHELSDELRLELIRLYRLDGGRQIIEKTQEKGLLRLESAFQ